MAQVTTDTAAIAAQRREHYVKTLLFTALPELVHAKPGFYTKATIPRGEGARANWRRLNRLAVATTPLSEGITPPSAPISYSKVFVDVNQYGNWVGFSDRVSVQSIDKVLTDNSKMLGQNAGETMDVLARTEYIKTTNVLYAGAANVTNDDIAAGDIWNDALLRKVRTVMTNNLAKRFGGSQSGKYRAIAHPDVIADLMATTLFQNVGYQQDKQMLFNGALPPMYGIEFYETTLAYTTINGTSVKIYYTLVFGPDAFGNVDVEDLDLENIFKALGSGGTSDPLNQRQTQGWKATFAAKVLNDSFVLNVISTATP